MDRAPYPLWLQEELCLQKTMRAKTNNVQLLGLELTFLDNQQSR
jgi:hypothetical protein